MKRQGTILIVSDQWSERHVLEQWLYPEGYALLYADSSATALSLVQTYLPNLIILAMETPSIHACTICAQLRANQTTAEVPILLITALDDYNTRIQGLQAGADDLLSKPIERIELGARVQTLLRVSHYRSLVEEHRRLEEQARQTVQELAHIYDTSLEAWVQAIDLRDKETAGHSRRVTELTVQLAQVLHVRDADIVHLRRGALLHDIGKLGIPDSILQKPGPLTEEEWSIMRQHPVLAYELIAPIPFLQPALDIPLYHHEKWDGTGYPSGLSGVAIPYAARIFAVVDVWDAMTSNRPYRAAYTPAQAWEYIQSLVGTHFDPEVVTAFFSVARVKSSSS